LNNTPFKSRTITVEISAPKNKRTETTIRRNTASATPDPETLPDAPSTNDEVANTNAQTYKERTLAILNLADTVNSARLGKLVETYGVIKKISLRPDHGGAFIEFAEEKSVGVASLALEGIELDGKPLKIGTVQELLKQNPEHKASKIAERLKTTSKSSGGFGLGSGVVSRPGQGARRGGRGGRGGLGKRTGLGYGAPKEDQSGRKTNEEFREMFLKGTTNGTTPKERNGQK
jgi:squamous cell carcinoma antigen recognized by T-cells 3